MISYHLEKADPTQKNRYFRDFKVAHTNDVQRIARGILSHVWSPIEWVDGRRRQDNFRAADWCVLDFDSGEMDLKAACKVFCDRIHIIGTTKSHTPERHRFRVLFRFEPRITSLRVYQWNMHKILDRFPEADSACKDGARYFFPCREIVQMLDEGYSEDVDFKVPDWFGKSPQTYKMLREAGGGIPNWTKRQLADVIPKGQRNTTLYRIAKDLALVGMAEDAIMSLILNSPTYKGQQVASDLHREIVQTVRSGLRKAQAEAANWKDDADD